MHQKKIERKALIVGIVFNIIMALAGFVVFFITGLKAMFLDAAFTVISVVSGAVAAYLSSKTVRTTERFPNGMFALEPIYAICKAMFTLSLLVFSFLDVTQVAIDYFFFGIGERLEFGPVVIYQIAAVAVCLILVAYYKGRNHSIGNVSTMLKAEANGTWIDGMISLGIGVVAVLLFFLPNGTALDFLHYTGDFFITTAIVIMAIKEPFIVLRDAFVELVGGVHDDSDTEQFVTDIVSQNLPVNTELDKVHIFKTGMNFDVRVFLRGDGESVRVEDLITTRDSIERKLEKKLHIVNVDYVFE